MLRNLSYKNPEIIREVEQAVGAEFSLLERIKMGGNGSGRLEIKSVSPEIKELLDVDSNLNYCSVEILKRGIIVRFRSRLETYGLIIPLHQLVIYKGEAQTYSLMKGEHKISVKADAKTSQFFKKLMDLKAAFSGTRIEDV